MCTSHSTLLLFCLINAITVNSSLGVLCFNCTSTHRSWTGCGDATDHALSRNKSQRDVVNCVEENALCFIRSWRARAKHAWIVQRGCYEINNGDTPPVTLSEGGTMSCKRQRFPNAEYQLCFCQADQCNGSSEIHLESQLISLPILSLFLNFIVY